MFGFAQFAPLLPYILLAITSFVSLTGYTLNYTQNKLADESTDKEIQMETAQITAIERTSCHFHDITKNTELYSNETDQIISNQEQSLQTPPYICSFFSEKLDLSLNQRPPPSYSFA